jgi:hypothetical protein
MTTNRHTTPVKPDPIAAHRYALPVVSEIAPAAAEREHAHALQRALVRASLLTSRREDPPTHHRSA